MILNNFDFCEKCPEFEPVVNDRYYDNVILIREITCAHNSKCKNIAEHIANEELRNKPYMFKNKK